MRSRLRAVGLAVVGILSRAKALRIPIAILHRMVFCRDQPFYRFHTVRKYEDAFREALRRYRKQHPGKLTLVDVGGRSGVNCRKVLGDMTDIEYWGIDLESYDDVPNLLVMDICEPLEEGRFPRFDLVFSHNAFEHFQEPFIAAKNCAKLIKPGGLLLVSTVFAYHQHMSPSDYFRYTDEGLKHLFTKYGFETDECGYDVSRRRLMKTGGRVPQSAPLIDWMGGWLERWFVYLVGHLPAEK